MDTSFATRDRSLVRSAKPRRCRICPWGLLLGIARIRVQLGLSNRMPPFEWVVVAAQESYGPRVDQDDGARGVLHEERRLRPFEEGDTVTALDALGHEAR